jgi:hypothetical protein
LAIFALEQVMLVGFRMFRVWFLDDVQHLHIVPVEAKGFFLFRHVITEQVNFTLVF